MPPWSFGISEEVLELLRLTFVVNTEITHMLKTNPAGRTAAKSVTAAATGGVVLVHSVKDRSALSSLTASAISRGKGEFACTSCGTHVVASSHAAPSCTTCGCDTKKVKAAAAVKYSNLVAIRCSHCDSVHLMEPKVIQASAHVHCAVCGHQNTYKSSVIESASKLFTAEAEDEGLEDAETASDDKSDWPFAGIEGSSEDGEADEPVEAGEDWPFDGEEASADEEPAPQPPTETAAGDDVEVEFESVDEPTAAAAEDEPESVPAAPAPAPALEDDELDDDLAIELEDLDDAGTPAPAQEASEAEVPLDAPEDESFLESSADEDDELYEAADLDEGEMLADSMGMDDTAAGLNFQATAGRLVAMKGHVSIASLKRENAGANADIMMSSSFATAVKHAANSVGLRKALVAAGFTPIRIQSLSKASVARKVNEVQQASANSVAKSLASFSESLALASAGLARGSWKGKQNPLKSAFVATLAQIGVKNPERVVARVLSESSVAFAQSLMEVATELNSMSPAARKETARILELTEVVASNEGSDDTTEEDEVVEASDIAGRLSTTAAVLPSVLSPSVAISKKDANLQSIQARATSRALDILDGNAPLTTLG